MEPFLPGTESFLPGTESFLLGTESFLPGTEPFLPGTESFLLGTGRFERAQKPGNCGKTRFLIPFIALHHFLLSVRRRGENRSPFPTITQGDRLIVN